MYQLLVYFKSVSDFVLATLISREFCFTLEVSLIDAYLPENALMVSLFDETIVKHSKVCGSKP